MTDTPTAPAEPAEYRLIRDGEVIDTIARDGLDGCLSAVGQAAWHSVGHSPVSVLIVGDGDTRLLGRWVDGRQQLDPPPARSWRTPRYPVGAE